MLSNEFCDRSRVRIACLSAIIAEMKSFLRMHVDFEGFCIVRSGNFTKNALCVTFTKRFSSSSQLRSNILAIRAPWREMNIFHVFYALTVDFNTILYRESISDPSFSFAAVFSQ